MKKIITMFIHLLGGYTRDEYFLGRMESYSSGLSDCSSQEKSFADKLFGVNAEDWCKQMYGYLEKKEKEYKCETK